MTATTAPARRVQGATTPGFGATLASEWTKLKSVRSTWIIIGLAIVLSIGFSGLIAWVQGLTYDDWGPNEQAAFDPLVNSLSGFLFGIILLIVFGVMIVTSEYGSRMIRTTFITTPQRLRVLTAKALIVGLTGMVLIGVMIIGMFLISQAIFGAYGLETTSFGEEGVNRVVLTSILAGGLIYTLIPLSVAFLLRGTASAITVSIGLFFLPWMFAPLLPRWFQENVIAYLPDLAMDSLSGVTPTDSATYISQNAAIFVIAIWLVVGLVLASITLKRRDA